MRRAVLYLSTLSVPPAFSIAGATREAKIALSMALVGEVEDWAERGGTKATAAKWIRCLVSEGDDRLTPSRVRLNYKKAYPYAA